MDLIEARSDGEHVLASGLTPGEVAEVLEWWRYTKPFGPDVKILVREPSGRAFGVSTTGTAMGDPRYGMRSLEVTTL